MTSINSITSYFAQRSEKLLNEFVWSSDGSAIHSNNCESLQIKLIFSSVYLDKEKFTAEVFCQISSNY